MMIPREAERWFGTLRVDGTMGETKRDKQEGVVDTLV